MLFLIKEEERYLIISFCVCGCVYIYVWECTLCCLSLQSFLLQNSFIFYILLLILICLSVKNKSHTYIYIYSIYTWAWQSFFFFRICKQQSLVKHDTATICNLCLSTAHKLLSWKGPRGGYCTENKLNISTVNSVRIRSIWTFLIVKTKTLSE